MTASARTRLRESLYAAFGALAPQRPVCVILMYHSVSDTGSPGLRREAFTSQLDWLARRFTVVPVGELQATMRSSPDRNVAVITFDDGYRDNIDTVAPLLRDHGMRATFFIATGYVGRTMETSVGSRPMMTRDHLRMLAGLGHELGAHTMSHQRLTRVPQEAACAEVRDSKRHLEDLLGRPVSSFAYPWGDWNHAVRAAVEEYGFTAAVTTRWGPCRWPADWLALPRIGVRDAISPGTFAVYTSPAVYWIEGARRLARTVRARR